MSVSRVPLTLALSFFVCFAVCADVTYTATYDAILNTNSLGADLVPSMTATGPSSNWTSSISAPTVPGESAHTTPSASSFTISIDTAVGGTGSAGIGPATGDDNEFDTGENLTTTFSAISPPTSGGSLTGATSNPALTLTGIDFSGLGLDDAGDSMSEFEYFTLSAGSFSTSFVDEDVTAAMITNAGLNPTDFTVLTNTPADSIDGLSVDITTGFDVAFNVSDGVAGAADNKGRFQSFQFTATAVSSAVPEPSAFLFLALASLFGLGARRVRKAGATANLIGD